MITRNQPMTLEPQPLLKSRTFSLLRSMSWTRSIRKRKARKKRNIKKASKPIAEAKAKANAEAKGGLGPDSKCKKHPKGNHLWKDCRMNPKNQNKPYPFQAGRGGGRGGYGGRSGRGGAGRGYGAPPRDSYYQQFGVPGHPPAHDAMSQVTGNSQAQEPYDNYTNQAYGAPNTTNRVGWY